ncbi:hypothetical protein ACHAXS_002669 [Conticribra weissflogii]
MAPPPLPPPPTSGNSAGSSISGTAGGLGRSAPIRTLPTMMSGTAVAVATSRGGHPSAPLSGGLSTRPPSAAASATSTAATAAIGGRTAYAHKKTVTDNVARATGTGTVAYATRNPVNPLPARQRQPVQHPLMSHANPNPNTNPDAPTGTKYSNDHSIDPKPAAAADLLELARNSGHSPPMEPSAHSSQRMHHHDPPQQPHIVPLPPPLMTPPSQEQKQQQQQADFRHPLENVGKYPKQQQQEMFFSHQQQKQSYHMQQQQTSAHSSLRPQQHHQSQNMSQTQTDSSQDYQQQQQPPPDPPQLFQTSSFQKPQPRIVSKMQSKPHPSIQQREIQPQQTQSQMQSQSKAKIQPPPQIQPQPAKTISSQVPLDPSSFDTPSLTGAIATAATIAPPPPPTSSISATNNATTATTEKSVPRMKTPTTPDEELDVFLLTASATDTYAYSQQQNQPSHQLSEQQQQPPCRPKIRPAPLPPTENIVQKAQILAVRRAWGDVIRVTNDALIVKNVDGSGIPTHHECYAELIAAASASTSGSASSSSSTNASALTPHVANTSGLTRSPSEIARLRKETCQLITLRLISHAKLRRYVDLGKEVGQLGLIPHLPCHSSCLANVGNVENATNVLKSDKVVDASSIVPPSPVEDSELVSFSAVTACVNSSTGDSLSWKEGSLHHLTSNPSSYPAKDPTPSWVPYGLRILAAQQLQYSDGGSKAVDVLYDMMDRVTRSEYWGGGRAGNINNAKPNGRNDSMEIWKSTISNALVNTFVRKREWRMALRCLEDMLDGLEDGVELEVDWWCRGGGKYDNNEDDSSANPAYNNDPNGNPAKTTMSDTERQQMKELITSSATVELLSRQLLILLQSGAIRAAELLQRDVRHHAAKVQEWLSSLNFHSDPSSPSSMTTMFRLHRESALVRQAPLRQMLNEGLLHFARFRYSSAMKCFRDVLNQQRELRAIVSNTMANHPLGCPTWKDMTCPTLGFDAEPTLTVECLNNFSLCLLYSCNMRMAVQEMEALIREDPAVYLTEGMAFNLCTLYELGSDGEDCVRRKKILQRVAKRFYLHDIGVESFRLS